MTQRDPAPRSSRPGTGSGWAHRHRDVSGGWLRPAVFGAVDGLVAGAFSMGAGEYVSVTNQNELVHAEVALEADMHARFPQQEHDEPVDRFVS